MNDSAKILPNIQIGPGIIDSPGSGSNPPRNSTEATADITTMPPYSDSRKKANFRPVYSVYAPKMISESATGMSNGGRVSSATAAIIHTMNSGNSGITYQIFSCASVMPTSDRVPASITAAAAASTSGSS